MKIISFCNQKGGVGKTTSTVNLATAIATTGRRVLLIDLDPQGNAGASLGIRSSKGSYELLIGKARLEDVVLATKIPHLFVAPSSQNLVGAEVELVSKKGRESFLKDRLKDVSFDYIFIDTPPSLGFLTLNALTASNGLIIPLQCDFFSLEGLAHIIQTFRLVKQEFNPSLELEGLLLTMYDGRTRLSTHMAKEVRSHFKDKVFQTVIPRNIKIAEAPSHGVPGVIFDLHSVGSKAYIQLGKEFLKKEETHDKRL